MKFENHGKKWTKEDEEILCELWGKNSYKVIGQKLGRSVASVKRKGYILNLGNPIENGEFLSFGRIAKAFSRSDTTGYEWLLERWSKAGLKIQMKTYNKTKVRVVRVEEFWKFAKKNPRMINFALLEEGELGVEPDWVNDIRKYQIKNPTRLKPNRCWSNEELRKLLFMVKAQRYTYADISADIGRSEAAIKRKLYDLGCKSRPVHRDTRIKWTQEEKEKLIKLYRAGVDYTSIALELKRSQFSIYEQVKRYDCK